MVGTNCGSFKYILATSGEFSRCLLLHCRESNGSALAGNPSGASDSRLGIKTTTFRAAQRLCSWEFKVWINNCTFCYIIPCLYFLGCVVSGWGWESVQCNVVLCKAFRSYLCQFRLYYLGVPMANCRTLKDYFVEDEAKMYIIGGVQVPDIAYVCT